MKTNPTGAYLMRPPHQRATEFLSRRYDLTAYDYENITWEFYESLHKSAPTAMALKEGENSIEAFRLEKYIKLTQVPRPKPPKADYPPPFNKLLALQTKTGKWMDPDQVRRVLDVPNDLTLSNTTPWEEATALALAAMRIRCDLFDLLQEYHDKAIGLISDKSLLYRAAHIVGAKELDRRDQIVHDRGVSDMQRAQEEEQDRQAIIPRNERPVTTGHNFESAGGVRESQLSGGESLCNCESISNATSITKYTYVDPEPYDFSKPKGRNSTLSNSAYVPITPLPAKSDPPPQAQTQEVLPVVTPVGKSRPDSRGSAKPHSSSSRSRTPKRTSPSHSPKRTLSFGGGGEDEPPNELAVSVAAAVDAIVCPPDVGVDAGPSMPAAPVAESRPHSPSRSPNKLAAMMAKTQHTKDLPRIAGVTQEIEKLKMKIIESVTAVDRHVEELKGCIRECAAGYSDASLFAVRNVQFGRLTAMLGDGFVARPGLDDWRSQGASGFRPLVVRCLGFVYRLAQARLLLEELQDPGRANPRGEDYVDLTNYIVSLDTVCASRSARWSFVWDGEEVVSKILHSLDFLRSSAELSEWYGRSFFFTANPLMLPFPMDMAACVTPLDMLARIQQELTSQPWMLTAPRDLTQDWQYQGYLVHWCNTFNELCLERHSFNWPSIPNIKEDEDRDALFVAMLMLHTKCFVDILDSVEREHKFITLSGTQRGAHLLVWETASPPPKPRRYIVPPIRKHENVENFVAATIEKRQVKLLAEHNAALGIFPDDPTLTATERAAAKDRAEGMQAYNEMMNAMMAANPVPAAPKKIEPAAGGKKISLHKLKKSGHPVTGPRAARSSKLIIGTSADITRNKQLMNVKNADAIRQHTYKTLGGADAKHLPARPLSGHAAGGNAVVVQSRDDAPVGVSRLKQSTIRVAGSTLPAIGRSAIAGSTPASGAKLRGDTMYAGAGGGARASASAPSLESTSEKRRNKLGKKLSLLVNSGLSSTGGAAGSQEQEIPVRSVVTRVPRASMVSDSGKLTRRATAVKRA